MASDLVERLLAAVVETDEQDRLHREAAERIKALEERLEINHAYQVVDGEMVRVKADMSDCDGIMARDETIRLQDEQIKELNAAILELQAAACARDGVPMPSERPLVDKLRERIAAHDAECLALGAEIKTLRDEGQQQAARIKALEAALLEVVDAINSEDGDQARIYAALSAAIRALEATDG